MDIYRECAILFYALQSMALVLEGNGEPMSNFVFGTNLVIKSAPQQFAAECREKGTGSPSEQNVKEVLELSILRASF